MPARNGFELVAELMNAGSVPAPYAAKGFGGRAIELVVVDEAAVLRSRSRSSAISRSADLIVGYISGDCLAIAPVAEELKKLTVLFDCGTPRIFEDASYKYVFRTGPSGAMDNVAAALRPRAPSEHPLDCGHQPELRLGPGLVDRLRGRDEGPQAGIEVKTSLMTKLFAGQFGAEISTLLSSGADLVHSSFWGADLEGLVLQGAPRGLSRSTSCCSRPASRPSTASAPASRTARSSARVRSAAPDSEFNRWFRTAFQDRYGVPQDYAAYKATNALLGLKAAYEKAPVRKRPARNKSSPRSRTWPSKVSAARCAWRSARATRRSWTTPSAPRRR